MFVNVKIEMTRNRMAIEELAKKLNMHRNTLTKKIQGKTDWTLPEMKRLGGIFNKSIIYLSAEEDINGTA